MKTLTHYFLQGHLTLEGKAKLYQDWIKDNKSQLKYSSPAKMQRMHKQYWLRHLGHSLTGLILQELYTGVDLSILIYTKNPFI